MAVLTVLLTILKIIGIVLLVLLCLIVAIVLLVLFAPIRWQAHLLKTDSAEDSGSSDSPLQADAHLTWLLELLSVDIHYPAEDAKASVQVKLGPKVLWSNHKAKDSGGKDRPSPAPADPQSQLSEPAKQEQVKAGSEPSPQSSKAAAQEQPQGGAEPTSQSSETATMHEQQKPAAEKTASEQSQPAKKKKGLGDRRKKGSAGAKKKEKSSGRGAGEKFGGAWKENVGQKASVLWERAWNFFARLLEAPSDADEIIDKLVSKVEHKIHSLERRFGPLTDAEARRLYGKILREMKFLLSCYGPRKAEGYLRFGTDSPDLTGKLAGFIYLLLPADSEEFDLQPDFFNSTFSADMTLSGRIRLCHVARVGVSLITDKEVGRLLAFIRHRRAGSGH